MKKYVMLLALLATGAAQASTRHWLGTYDLSPTSPPGNTNWINADSWAEEGFNFFGIPVDGDTVVIQKYFWGNLGNDSGVSSVLGAIANLPSSDVYIAQVDAGGAQVAQLDLVGGANLTAQNLLMAQPTGSIATLKMSGNAAMTIGGFFNGAGNTVIHMGGASTLDITITMVDQAGGTWGITMTDNAVLSFAGGLPEYANNEITALNPEASIVVTNISGAIWQYTVSVPFPDPWVLNMAVNGSSLNFDWHTRNGKLYDLESTESLSGAGWLPYNDGVNIFTNIPASGLGIKSLSGVQHTDPSRFFRVKELDFDWERPMVDILYSHHTYNPHIIHEPGEEYEFKMWFFGWANADTNPGWPGEDATYFARSKDLDSWEVWKGDGWEPTGDTIQWVPVLTADTEYFDQQHAGDPSVVKKEGIYYMAYSATGFDLDGFPAGHANDTDKGISVVRMASSTNGIDWIRSTLPVLMHDNEIGEPEITYLDDPETPEDESTIVIPSYTGNFHRPSLMWDIDHWRLWFDYWAPSPLGTSVGHAECYGDPMIRTNWNITHDLGSPLLQAWPNPDVVKHGSTYYMYGDPHGYPGETGWPGRQTKEAVSLDGINWTVTGFIDPDSDVTTAHQIPEALVLDRDGHTWLYVFTAVQIGGDPYNFRYNRMRYWRRLLD